MCNWLMTKKQPCFYNLVKVTAAYKKRVSDSYYILKYKTIPTSIRCEECKRFHVNMRQFVEISYEQLAQRIWNTFSGIETRSFR